MDTATIILLHYAGDSRRRRKSKTGCRYSYYQLGSKRRGTGTLCGMENPTVKYHTPPPNQCGSLYLSKFTSSTHPIHHNVHGRTDGTGKISSSFWYELSTRVLYMLLLFLPLFFSLSHVIFGSLPTGHNNTIGVLRYITGMSLQAHDIWYPLQRFTPE